jgi:hypothetical protein
MASKRVVARCDLAKKGHVDDDDSILDAAISELQSAVFPLLFVTPTQVQCVGTAFCIAGAGVLATARHVIDDVDRLIGKARPHQ